MARSILVIADIPADLRNALADEFTIIDYNLEAGTNSGAVPPEHQVVVTRAIYGFPAAAAELLPDARLLLSLGAGLERIDTDLLRGRGIELIHTPDELTEDVADFAIGLAYAVRRRIAEGDRFVRSGQWQRQRFGLSHNLSRARAGVLGMGRIGRRIAEKAQALGLSVACVSGHAADLPYHREPDAAALAAASDILFVACAGTAATERIIDADVLAALGPEGCLVNISRGSTVDEEALIAALEAGTIAGAALDVFASEPGPDPRFAALDNVVLSPHAASFTHDARQVMIRRLVEGARRFFAARP